MFVEFVYLKHYKTPDSAWIRNIYILLSFYTELILKAIYVYEKKHKNKKQLEKIFKFQHKHDLENIAKDIGQTTLEKYGIKEVKRMRSRAFRFKTDIGTYDVMDFVDIRYDFIEGKIRKIKGDEHEMFDRQIRSINHIATFLNGPAWN